MNSVPRRPRIAGILLALAGTLTATGVAGQSPASAPDKGRAPHTATAHRDWPVYGGNAEGTHYAPLSQIHRGNVHRLQQAWTYDTGETGVLQTSPLAVNGVLYGISPTQKVFALDAATGKLIWRFDSGIPGSRLTPQQMAATIRGGEGRMPGFPSLSDDEVSALISFLSSGQSKELASTGPASASKYDFTGYHKFLDPEGYPAITPPWGTLTAIDLNSGKHLWKIPLGEYPELAAKGLKDTGTENYGGPIVTAGGVLFIGATDFDRKFRAFDSATGKLLWETTLPFAGNATPITYQVNGRQYVVIAAGGGKDEKWPSGGTYVAFALPQAKH